MSQADTVLRMLRDAGSRGVHTFELRQEYIGNPSQRIAELEGRGHLFTRTREKLNGQAIGTRYRLVSSPSGPVADATPSTDSPSPSAVAPVAGPEDPAPSLFDATPSFDELCPPRSAIYGEAA